MLVKLEVFILGNVVVIFNLLYMSLFCFSYVFWLRIFESFALAFTVFDLIKA